MVGNSLFADGSKFDRRCSSGHFRFPFERDNFLAMVYWEWGEGTVIQVFGECLQNTLKYESRGILF